MDPFLEHYKKQMKLDVDALWAIITLFILILVLQYALALFVYARHER
jgi:hypothetical protein